MKTCRDKDDDVTDFEPDDKEVIDGDNDLSNGSEVDETHR